MIKNSDGLFEMPPIKKGSILISEPFLKDPNFERAVVLVCEHGKDGTFGLVLNKQIEISLEDILEDFAGIDKKLLFGGPVEQNTLHFIHKLGKEVSGSREIAKGIFWGGDFDKLKSQIFSNQIDINKIKFFLGYSGWDEGQLESEINQKTWLVADLGDNSIFDAEETDLWKRVLHIMGGEFKWLANSPQDPRMN